MPVNADAPDAGRRIPELPLAADLVMDPARVRATAAASTVSGAVARRQPALGLAGLALVISTALALATGWAASSARCLCLGRSRRSRFR